MSKAKETNKKGVYCAHSVNFITLKKNNDKKYLLALLNSRLLNFIIKRFNTSSDVNGYEINNLPIVETQDKETIKKITTLVDKIITVKQKNIQQIHHLLKMKLIKLCIIFMV